MKILGRILLVVIVVGLIAGILAYTDGVMLPVDHTTSVSGIIDAPPARVYALITNVAQGASWRHSVQSVQVLPPDNGRDRWTEDLGHGQSMTFLVTRSEPVDASGNARREVLLNDPGASYGGTWTYELSPGPSAGQTTLRITETGFVHPPLYRFMMAHVFGMTKNLDQYMSDLRVAVARS